MLCPNDEHMGAQDLAPYSRDNMLYLIAIRDCSDICSARHELDPS